MDGDGDVRGEFGFFGEMSGSRVPRGRNTFIPVPLLSGAFKSLGEHCIHRSGYRFRLFLPAADGRGIVECRATGDDPPLPPGLLTLASTATDPDAGERHWCAYAWPETYGNSGDVTFFIDETGVVLGTDDPGYHGDSGPRAGSAYRRGGRDVMTGPPAVNARGQDGNTWRETRFLGR